MYSKSKLYLWFGLAAVFSLAIYLATSRLIYRIGFPLDDAWIHQTYAHNLATRAEWAFLPGQPSAGSTAPLWSAVLAIGHLVGLGPYLWTYFLGGLALFSMAVLGALVFERLCPSRAALSGWVGLLLVFEWHVVWAAASGMETICSMLLALVVLGGLLQERKNWPAIGALIGLSVWIRPDGITLAGPALMTLLLTESNWKSRLRSLGRLSLGVALPVLPYLAFNQALAGAWWPNTFFAKQVEYASLRQLPLWRRYLAQLGLPLVGVGVVLLPGFCFYCIQALKSRRWGVLAGAIWLAGFLFVYAWRLPVTYQHGRYVMPAMPVYWLWGLAGMTAWTTHKAGFSWQRALGRAWGLSAAMVLLIFWVLGARAYAMDVAVIESEMVQTALWVFENTQTDALLAVHDIGAVGYFAGRELIDLAGLASPEVIPFMRDEEQLAAFLTARGADYLVAFPAWYPGLARQARLLYQNPGQFSPILGGENMAVYEWVVP